MGNPLRDRRLVTELAAGGQIIEFAEEIRTFESLAEIVQTDLDALNPDKVPSAWRESVVSGELRFDFVDTNGRIPGLRGRVTLALPAVCQRCLEPFELAIGIEPDLLLLGVDEIAEGFEDIEVWELDEPGIKAQDIVEELLIMALPFAAMHDNRADCKALLATAAEADESNEDLVKPFAALRSQMQQKEKDPDI